MKEFLVDLFSQISIGILAGLVGFAITVFKTFKFVREGERGIILRFGRARRNPDGTPRVIEPGFIILIPYIEALSRRHIRQQTLRFDKQRIIIKMGLTFEVNAVVIFHVKDVYKALFEIDNLDEAISNLCMGILRDVIQTREYAQLSDTAAINQELLHHVQEKAKQWGVEFLQFSLTSCAPAPESANIINTAAGAKVRLEALTEASKTLGVQIQQLNPILASVLIGVPLSAAITGRAGEHGAESRGNGDKGSGNSGEDGGTQSSLEIHAQSRAD